MVFCTIRIISIPIEPLATSAFNSRFLLCLLMSGMFRFRV